MSVGVMYGIFQYRVYTAESAATVDNEARIAQVKKQLSGAQSDFKEIGGVHAGKQRDFDKTMATILPQDENYTELTRLLDNFFSERDAPDNPLFQSSLRFGKGTPVTGMPGISILPISMNIEGTRDNFFKFLDFVNNSGSLDNGVRLFEISSIQLNFPEGGEVLKDLKQKINFTVDMNAYHRTPKVRR